MKTICIHNKAMKLSLVDGYDPSAKSTRFRFDPLYSGGPAYVDGFDAPAYVDLATLRVDPAPKALLGHDFDAVVGRLENIENDGERVVCDAIVGGNELAAKVVGWAKDVAAWVPSIGVYRFDDRDIQCLQPGEKARINGRDAVGPAYIIRNGSLCEGSFVAIGGDAEAVALMAKLKTKHKGAFNMGTDEEKRDDEVLAEVVDDEEKDVVQTEEDGDEKLECEGDAPIPEDELTEIVQDAVEQAAADTGEEIAPEIVEEVAQEIADELEGEADPVAASLRASKLALKRLRARCKPGGATTSERRRVEALKTLCSGYGKSGARVCASAIANGWSVERAGRVLDAKSDARKLRAGLRRIGSGYGELRDDRPRKRDILCAAFAQTLGMSPNRIKQAFGFDQRVVDAAQSAPYRNATFRTVVAESLNSFAPGSYSIHTGAAAGWRDCKSECMRARLSRGASFRADASFSTIVATDVFQLVLQAFLEPSEETAPRVYPQLTRENKLVDFNQVDSYLPTIQGRLQKISETGAIQNVGFTTEKFTRKAEPLAATFSIPEMVIVNDQIDVFAELLRQLESLGEDCIEHDVAETFWRLADGDIKDASGSSLVSGSVGNYISSGSLSENGLAAAIKALNSFSSGNGVPLASDRLILVAGSELAPSAFKLWNAGYVDFQNGTAYPNVFRGRFTPVEWQYLDSARARAKKDNGSTASVFAADKTWLLLRDPQRRPAVCVNKVIGFESPRIEQFDADPSVWGTTYRYVYPYSVSAQYKDAIIATTNS